MELEAYKAELAREILMSNSRQLLLLRSVALVFAGFTVSAVLHGESSTVSDIAKEDTVEYKTKTKTEILSDLEQACQEAKLIREGKAKGISAEDLLNEL